MTISQSSGKASALTINGHQSRGAVAVGGLAVSLAANALGRKGAVIASLLADWPAIAGPSLAAYTMPHKLTRGTVPLGASNSRPSSNLHLKVDPVRALDVQYKVPQLIERINQALGYKAIGTIRLVQTPLPRKPLKLEVAAMPSPEIAASVAILPSSRLDRALAKMKSNVLPASGGNGASR